jgi:hypothetical protein
MYDIIFMGGGTVHTGIKKTLETELQASPKTKMNQVD